MGMPEARATAPLDLIGPDRTSNAIEGRTATTKPTFPKLMLGRLQMLETLGKVRPSLDRQSHQERP
jgi:hypothetical protein